MMSPVGRLVMLRVVSKAELVRSMAWLMIPATIGPIVGPPVGGFIVTYLSWHWIFYINVPIGLAGIALVTIFIDEMKEPDRTKFDLRGLFLSGTALACLMCGIEVASQCAGSSGIVAVLLGAGANFPALYWVHARRTPRPMLDFRLLHITTFRMLLRCGSLSRIAVGATPFLLPMLFQLGFGLSAANSGLERDRLRLL
jgi:MFS family permease